MQWSPLRLITRSFVPRGTRFGLGSLLVLRCSLNPKGGCSRTWTWCRTKTTPARRSYLTRTYGPSRACNLYHWSPHRYRDSCNSLLPSTYPRTGVMPSPVLSARTWAFQSTAPEVGPVVNIIFTVSPSKIR